MKMGLMTLKKVLIEFTKIYFMVSLNININIIIEKKNNL